MEHLNQLMSLIDVNATKIDEGDYLKMCSSIKNIFDEISNQLLDDELFDDDEFFDIENWEHAYPGVDFMPIVSPEEMTISQMEKFIKKYPIIKRVSDKRRRSAMQWYAYDNTGISYKNIDWMMLERMVGHHIQSLQVVVYIPYMEFYNRQVEKVKRKLEMIRNM